MYIIYPQGGHCSEHSAAELPASSCSNITFQSSPLTFPSRFTVLETQSALLIIFFFYPPKDIRGS